MELGARQAEDLDGDTEFKGTQPIVCQDGDKSGRREQRF
jgi:hypothetical protein